MRNDKKSNPTLLEILNYWLEQEKKNLGKMNIAHYMKVCEAKSYMVRFDDNNKMIRI
jgi:hypothetical protein